MDVDANSPSFFSSVIKNQKKGWRWLVQPIKFAKTLVSCLACKGTNIKTKALLKLVQIFYQTGIGESNFIKTKTMAAFNDFLVFALVAFYPYTDNDFGQKPIK